MPSVSQALTLVRRKRCFFSQGGYSSSQCQLEEPQFTFSKDLEYSIPLPIVSWHSGHHWTSFYHFQSTPLGKTRQFWSSSYFWEGITPQSLYSLSIFHDPQALLPSAKRYLSQFNVLISIKLLWSCPAPARARTAVCVWPLNEWDQGKTLVTREFLQVFSSKQIKFPTSYMSQLHTQQSQPGCENEAV